MTGFDSKRQMAKAKLDDDSETLLLVYQQGFADGKRSQRKPLTEELVYKMWDEKYRSWIGGEQFESIARAVERAHSIKEGT